MSFLRCNDSLRIEEFCKATTRFHGTLCFGEATTVCVASSFMSSVGTNLGLLCYLLTTSKALVTTSDALVSNSFLLLLFPNSLSLTLWYYPITVSIGAPKVHRSSRVFGQEVPAVMMA